jgi:HSP20 family protein
MRWNPGHELSPFPSDILNIQRNINRMFDGFFRGDVFDEETTTSAWTPVVDIAERDDAYVVKVELPGVSKDDVRITTQDNILTIRGEKKQEKESKGANYHRIERAYGSFQRSFTLPGTVKEDEIDPVFKDGTLAITLPKAEEAKPKTIEVKVK